MPEPPPETTPPRTLLILEADRPCAAKLAALAAAGMPGVEVRSATALEEGLRSLREGGIDLVLLGPGFAADLEQVLGEGGVTALVQVTEEEDEGAALAAIRRGAQDGLALAGLTAERLALSLLKAFGRSFRRRGEAGHLLARVLDSMRAAIAIAGEDGRILATNASWRSQDPSVNPLVPAGTDYAAFCRGLADGGLPIAVVARGFLAALSGGESRFVRDFTWGEGPGALGYGVTFNRFVAEGRCHVGIAIADITPRLRTEKRLRENEELFRIISENSTLGIAFVLNRRFEWANARIGEIMGRPLAEIIGATTRIAYPDDASYEEMGRTAYGALERGERTDITWHLLRGDGTPFWCRMVGRTLDPAHPDEGSVWLMEDTTEKRKIEQERLSLEVQLRHAQKLEAIGQLAAGIAHEINTPTQYLGDNAKFLAEAFRDLLKVVEAQKAVIGPVPQALRETQDEADLPYLMEEIPKAIEQSLEGIARVTRIVKAMKDFSHPGSEDPLEVDLNRSIESTITVSRNEWKYVADLALDLDPGLPPVLCYPNEINQAVLNLVVNAAHAIADALGPAAEGKGAISVSTSHRDGLAEIRVRDSGTGIPEHVRPRIFDPFFTTKEVGRGTGQGLAIVHTVVVERHKGTVAFETETGRGSVFILRIPIAGPSAGGAHG